MILGQVVTTLKETAQRWYAHDPGRLGAALAYYSIFSLGPLLLIIVAVAGFVLGPEAARGELAGQLRDTLGATAANAVEAMLANASNLGTGILAIVVGIATLLAAAVGIVIQLKSALNIVWDAEPQPSAGWWPIVRRYLISLAGILGAGFLLLASVAVSAAMASIAGKTSNLWPALNFILSFAATAALFAGMFKWLPDVEVLWSDAWAGGVVTAVLFQAGKAAIGWYIGRQGFESTHGAAASIVVLMVWIYYASQIVLFGAEFTRVWSDRPSAIHRRDGGTNPRT